MTEITRDYRGMALLVELNADRILTALVIAAALAAMALVGIEAASGHRVEAPAPAATRTL
ncbi:MAG: hypothetical protein D6832_05310 [Alphaproteobacteria bacterium]|nr:MAG: hypothetical protein D6832_05310 [Alphaproteobacteria bacterium]